MRPSLLAALTVALVGGPARSDEPFRLTGGPAKSFADLADVSVGVEPRQAKPGQVVTVRLTIRPKNGGWTYPFNPPADQLSRNDVGAKWGDLILVGQVTDPPGWKTKDGAIPGRKERYYPDPVTWSLTAVVSPQATAGAKSAPLTGSHLQVCNKGGCYNADPATLPAAEFEVLPGPAEPVPAEYEAEVRKVLESRAAPAGPSRGSGRPAPTAATEPKEVVGKKTAVPVEEYRAGLEALASKIQTGTDRTDKPAVGKDVTGLLLTAAFWGLVSLVTPCVFPMIPITVSLFLKQSNQSAGRTVQLSAAYALTIVGVLGLSAFFFLTTFRQASVDPWMNILLGLAFVAFALSLFGLFEMTFRTTLVVFLPVVAYALAWPLVKWAVLRGEESADPTGGGSPASPPFAGWGLAAVVAAVEGLLLFGGGGNSILGFLDRQRGLGGVVGTVFGAVAFSIVSFTCVAPFLGGFSAYAASGGYSPAELALAAVAFSGAFAFPFFFLALFPGLLRALPRAGGWLDSVKVVMGFLELAAVLKFFRTAELRLADQAAYFTYDLVLGGWVVIAGATGLYLLNLFRLPHDEQKGNVGVVRMLIALAFLGLGAYLAPALFKPANGPRPRPSGVVYAWVDAFLLPDSGEPWGTDLKAAVDRIAKAKRDGKPPEKGLIFLDFTGVTCTNCKYNEENVFTRPEVRELLQRYEGVQLYTDDVPAAAYGDPPDLPARRSEAAVNLWFQKKVFRDERLPLYAVLEPLTTGKVRVLGVYDEGKINDPAAFVEFLKKPFQK